MPSGRPARYMTWTDRITFDPAVMGGKPCIRGMRVTVGTVVGLVAARADLRRRFWPPTPILNPPTFGRHAAWRSEERDVPLASA